MKNWIYIIMIGLMGSLVSSCQQSLDDEVQTSQDSPKAANISMRLILDKQSFGSRGTWGKNEDESNELGIPFENEIDLTDPNALQVTVQVYDTDNTMIEELEVIDKTVVRLDTENGRVYTLDGILDFQDTTIKNGNYSCKVIVYANCGTDKEVYTYSAGALIPMWGVRLANLNLANEAENEIDDIYLLRAMAKVEVALHEDIVALFDLTDVVVDKYNTVGNVLPAGYATAVDTRDLGQQDVFNPNNTPSNTDLSFTEVEGQGAFYAYLPEYQNVGDDVSPATIKVVINGVSYTIEFKNYTSGKPNGSAYNIVRNHYYQYTITSINTVENVIVTSLSYKCMPWQEINNGNLNFGHANGDVRN